MVNLSVIDDIKFAKKIYFLILIFSFLWTAAALLTPLLFSAGGIFTSIASFFYIFFSSVCHQDDARSYHITGNILAVCSRCIWIYAGFFAGASIYPVIFRLNNAILPPLWILFAAAAIVFADAMLNIWEIYTNTFLSRSITGFIIGAVLPFYLIPGFIKFFYEINIFLKGKKHSIKKGNG